jgi:hypothetical protein
LKPVRAERQEDGEESKEGRLVYIRLRRKNKG